MAQKPIVLIVDDNPDILLLLRTNLMRSGFDVVEAAEGRAALRAIDERRPDVVLLDLMMPVLDGWGVLEELRDRPDAPPVIVVSAAASTANTERAYRLGARGYVTKPFSLEGLIEAIRDALKPSPQPLNK